MTLAMTFTGPVTITGLSDAQFEALLEGQRTISRKVDTILMDEALVIDSLGKIDVATTKAASNIQTLADTDQTISTELDTLNKALADALANGQGVSPALVAQASSLATRSQAVSDSLDAMVPALKAIASKGVTNPVPLPIPPTPPTI